MVISEFRGEYYFLSNFFPCTIKMKNGLTFTNAEAAFQSCKTEDWTVKQKFCGLTASEAKKLGRKVDLVNGWDEVKDQVMVDVVTEKFIQNLGLAEKLVETKDATLIEGNTWGDQYWGMCDGVGQNKLGYILMHVRAKINYLNV